MKTKATEWKNVSTQPLFNLYQNTTEPRAFQVRLKASGGYLRRRFNALNLENALDEAPRQAGLVKDETPKTITLVEAFTLALSEAQRNERSRLDWFRTTERFLLWLQKHHPLCTHWEMMNRNILRDYLKVYHGKSANHRRLSIQPLLQTAGYMHREHGFPNFGERMGIGNKLAKTPPAVYLEDAYNFCNWVRDHYPFLEAGVCLQGLAGLQLLEALRLTWDKVDLSRGLIEISGEVKNQYRNRVIPINNRVLEALERNHQVHQRTKCKSNFVVRGNLGNGFEDHCSYGRCVRKALLEWNPETNWAPKDLRNCLPTFAKLEGLHGTIWEQYIGHAPEGVTDRHYVPRLSAPLSGQKKALDRQMQLFTKFIISPIEAEICNFLQLSNIDQLAELT